MIKIHAYPNSSNAKVSCKHLGQLVEAEIFVQNGGFEAARMAYAEALSPDLLIIEVEGDAEPIIEGMNEIASYCQENTNVIVLKVEDDVTLHQRLTELGVSEFITGPVNAAILKDKITEIFSPVTQTVNHSTGIAFMSAHGGSGSSTIAQCFAWMATQDLGKKTILADFDLAFGTVGINLGMSNVTTGIAEALLAGDQLRSTAFQPLLTNVRDKLMVLPAPRDLSQAYDIPEELIPNLIDICHQEAPTVVFDLPNIWCAWVQSLLVRMRHVVLVTEPVHLQVKETAKLLEVLKEALGGKAALHVVVNQQGIPKRQELSQEKLELYLGLTPIYMPFDDPIFDKARLENRPVDYLYGQSIIKNAMAELSVSLLGEDPRNQKSSVSNEATGSKASVQAIKDRVLNLIFEPS